jgi:hypothetical protein
MALASLTRHSHQLLRELHSCTASASHEVSTKVTLTSATHKARLQYENYDAEINQPDDVVEYPDGAPGDLVREMKDVFFVGPFASLRS